MLRFLTIALSFGALVLSAPLRAAQPEHLTIPLSDPAQPAKIEVSVVMGSLTIVPGKAGEVGLTATARADEGDDDSDHERGHDRDRSRGRDDDRAGMHRIPNASLGLEAQEKNNKVEIGADSWAHPIDLRIEVPAASSVEASTVNDGEITVEGLSGELVLHNTNGDIEVRSVTGPVNATTVNGDVKVVFGPRLAAAAMAFSTLNGDVDVTLPADANLDVLLRSDNGDILSDFDVVLQKKPAKVEEDRQKGKYRIAVSKELSGRIGKGGQEIFLKTFNGDILLRKAKP
jgi:hypothetical protein